MFAEFVFFVIISSFFLLGFILCRRKE